MTNKEFKEFIRNIKNLIKTGNLEEVEKIFDKILEEKE